MDQLFVIYMQHLQIQKVHLLLKRKKKQDLHVQPTQIQNSPSSQPLTRSLHSSFPPLPSGGDISSPDNSTHSIQIFNPFALQQPSINIQIESLNETSKVSVEMEMENSRNVTENSRNVREHSRNTNFKEHTTENEMENSRMGVLKENELEMEMEISKNIPMTLEHEMEHSKTVNPIVQTN